MARKHSLDTPINSLSAVKRTRTANTVPKHTSDTPTSSSSSVERARTENTADKANTATTASHPLVKKSHRANFSRLCAIHNWTPSPIVRSKLSHLLQLSGPRLHAAELLPLAFVQHYPFIFLKDFLLLGYNDNNDSVWYKAFPSSRGIARGHYYNSAQENIHGKHTVKTFWQSWVDVFGIEERGLDRSHEYFTGVYLILQKFPNLRYKCCRDKPRDPKSAARVTGIAEFPFNDDHAFMQESATGNSDEAVEEAAEDVSDPLTESDDPDMDASSVIIKQERTTSFDCEVPEQSREPTPISSSLLQLSHRDDSQNYKEYTLRIPIDSPRWSTTKFEFAVVKAIGIAPEDKQ